MNTEDILEENERLYRQNEIHVEEIKQLRKLNTEYMRDRANFLAKLIDCRTLARDILNAASIRGISTHEMVSHINQHAKMIESIVNNEMEKVPK